MAAWEAAPLVEDTKPTLASAGARGLGLGVRDVLEGAAAVPGMVLDALTYPGRLINRSLGVSTTAPSDIVQSGINATGLPQPETSGEQLRSAAIRGGTSALTTAGVGSVPGVAAQFPAFANALSTAIPSQVVGGVTGGTAGEATRQAGYGPTAQTAASLIGGVAGPLATAGVGRVVSPVRATIPQPRQALVDEARREGIPLSPGEETGNRVLKNVEGAFAQLPGSAGREAQRQTETQLAFNAAMLRKGGQSGNLADPDTVKEALKDVGGGIGAIADRNILAVHPPLTQRLDQMEQALTGVPADTARVVQAKIDDIRKAMIPVTADTPGAPVAAIPGPSYRMHDTALGKAIRNTSNGDTRAALIELRQTLRASMDESISPEDAAEWQTLRRHYANLKVVQSSVSGAGEKAAEGNIPFLAVKGALDKSLEEGGYAVGSGDANKLARIGQSLLRTPPDPGTAQRAMMMRILQGTTPVGGGIAGAMLGGPLGAVAGAAAPFVLPRIAQAAYYSPAGRAFLANQLGVNLDTNLPAVGLGGLAAYATQNKLGPR